MRPCTTKKPGEPDGVAPFQLSGLLIFNPKSKS